MRGKCNLGVRGKENESCGKAGNQRNDGNKLHTNYVISLCVIAEIKISLIRGVRIYSI